MGSKGRTYKGLPQDPPIAGMAKKRTISTSLLETQVWETLNFLFAPSGGEKRMQLWLEFILARRVDIEDISARDKGIFRARECLCHPM
jgi:hypothetical protein